LVRAPLSGHVLSKTAFEGKAFMAGETLYEIGDLGHLWLRTAILDLDYPLIEVGQQARVTLPFAGHRTYQSTVTFLHPHIDPQTRRAEVRLELDNPGHVLRPDMWANVEIEVPVGRVLTLPASAVIDTGERCVAFVRREDAHLEPRQVSIGVKTDDYWQVLSGVKEGEQVVTRALFLVDSESQLKAAIQGMTGPGEGKQ
jgi:membrane fusion protein, copper/silver efflux system